MATSMLEVTRDDAQKLFKGLGSTQASKWTNSKLAKMLLKLPAKLEQQNGESKEGELNKKSTAVLDDVKDAVEKELKIKVIGDDDEGDEEEEAPARKSSKKSKSAKTSKKSKSAKAEKATTKKKSKKSKSTGTRGERGHTNKDKVFKIWAKKPTTKQAERAHSAVDEAVSLSTIRSWMSGWSRGQGLPTSAKDLSAAELKAIMKKAKSLKKKITDSDEE